MLARGLGRRMRETVAGPPLDARQEAAAAAGLKGLVPMTDGRGHLRPFLDFVLSALADAGFPDVVLVVAPGEHALRRRYAGEARPTRLRLEWAVQDEPRGTADAVLAAQDAVGDRPFVAVNADNLYPVEGLASLRALGQPGLLVFERDDLVRGGLPLERLAAFAMPIVSSDGALTDIVEKPDLDALDAAGPRAPVSMNAWRFDARIFGACRDVEPSPRGELELPDAVRLALRRGMTFRAVPARGPVLDLTRRPDIARVAAQLRAREVRL